MKKFMFNLILWTFIVYSAGGIKAWSFDPDMFGYNTRSMLSIVWFFGSIFLLVCKEGRRKND